jgi:hypothetical protein
MKIIYFDYWTKGAYNFYAIDELLKSKNHETLLLHVESFNGLKKGFLEEKISENDIIDFRTIFIYKALKKIKPDVIVSLNTTGILDRALVLAAKNLKIKTIFLMHGVIPIGEKLENEIKVNTKINKLSFKILKSYKYIKFYIPNYIYSILKYNFNYFLNFKWLKTLINHFTAPYKSMYFPDNTNELIHDKCLVYSNIFINYYRQIGYPEKDIKVVGNPTYKQLFYKLENNLFNPENLPEEVKILIKNKIDFAVYIDDGLYIYAYDDWDIKYMKKHLNQIATRLEEENCKLIVKVRPSTNISDIYIKHSNIIFLKNVAFEDLVYYCKFSIGHISTALNIPIILQKAIIIPGFEKSQFITDYFISNGVGNLWRKINDNIDLDINIESRKSYIEEQITILDSRSVERIVNEIENICY